MSVYTGYGYDGTARSATMYAIYRKSGDQTLYLKRSFNSRWPEREDQWTDKPDNARWYAYRRYAENVLTSNCRVGEVNAAMESLGAAVCQSPRSTRWCPRGGQKQVSSKAISLYGVIAERFFQMGLDSDRVEPL